MLASRAYARTQQETASKERLMVLLFETALRHIRTAAGLCEAKEGLQAAPLITKASDIVTELASTLDAERAPQLAEVLGPIYLFVCARLARAQVSRDPAPLREAERVFAPIVDAFAQAVAQLAVNP